MGREIKFRGKRISDEKWIYGNLVQDKENNRFAIIPQTGREHDYNQFEIILETIGQYTGLNDKNGKEVYEADLLCSFYKEKKHIKLVKYDDEKASYQIADINNLKNDDYYDIWSSLNLKYLNDFSFEIIGNIHENPELLK